MYGACLSQTALLLVVMGFRGGGDGGCNGLAGGSLGRFAGCGTSRLVVNFRSCRHRVVVVVVVVVVAVVLLLTRTPAYV